MSEKKTRNPKPASDDVLVRDTPDVPQEKAESKNTSNQEDPGKTINSESGCDYEVENTTDEDKVKKILSIVKRFYRDDRDEPWVEFEGIDGPIRCPVNKKEFEDVVCSLLLIKFNHELTSKSLQRMRRRITGYAHCPKRSEGKLRQALRLEMKSDNDKLRVFYNLSNSAHEAIEISEQGWKIVSEPPFFRSAKHLLAQVAPVRGGNFSLIDRFLSISNPAEKLLAKVWMLSQFLPGVERPALVFNGLQGSAKSTMGRLIRMAIDPAQPELMTFPKKVNELAVNFHHNYLPVYDNMSSINQDQSDMLCRAITGGCVQKRKLYTDNDAVTIYFKGGLILNGIEAILSRPDILERSITIRTQRLEGTEYLPAGDLEKEFKGRLPEILGGAFDIIAKVLANIKAHREKATLLRLPRMAEFAIWGFAIAEEAGIEGRSFLKAYKDNLDSHHLDVIENTPLISCISEFLALEINKGKWEGTATKLHSELETVAESQGFKKLPLSWPKDPSHLSRDINKYSVNLKACGIEYQATRTNKGSNISLQMSVQLPALPSPTSSLECQQNPLLSDETEPSDASDGKNIQTMSMA